MKHHVARITLETKTALAINTGKQDGVFDTSLVTDANGLPAIPATSITGVLRHLFKQFYGEESANTLFGFQKQSAQNHDDKGQISQLNISWGHLNDSKGKVIEGIDFEDKIASDKLLSSAFEQAMISPLIRDRTVSNSRGVSKNKFDVSILQQGHRFSFELSYWDKSQRESTDTTDDSLWEKALMTLFHPLFRLGSNTRNGLGAISIVQLQTRAFDLQEENDQQAYIEYTQTRTRNNLTGFEDKLNIYQTQAEEQTKKYLTKISLTLEPTGFWRFGQGNHPQKIDSNNKIPDLLPKMEESITWDNHKGKVGDLRLLIAASSIKGAIAHRVAFHANRLNNVWVEDFEKDQIATYNKSEECETVKRIFGYAANEKRTEDIDIDDKEIGHVGALIINDTYISFKEKEDLKVIMHNSIDRFTAGVRKGMLYSEEMVWGKNIELNIYLDESKLEDIDKKALHLALEDLAQGRLSLGARAAVGHGFFKDTQYQNPFDGTQGKAQEAQGEAQ